MPEMLYKDESWKILGAALEVHKKLGCGFLEKVYQEALAIEFSNMGIPFEREKAIKIAYDGIELSQEYIADFVCYGKIIVELKAVKTLEDVHKAQVYNYLRATGLKVGYLFNFGETSLKKERLVWFDNKVPRKT